VFTDPDITLLEQPERLSSLAQTKLTPTEAAGLDEMVRYLRGHGIKATRSSVLRMAFLTTFRAYQKELEVAAQK